MPIPAGRVKQKMADITGIMMFIDFMEAAIGLSSFFPLFCWGKKRMFSHWDHAASTGTARAPMISTQFLSAHPMLRISLGESAIFIPRK